MSICQICRGKEERAAPHARLTREYYDVLIAALRHVAYRHGYALAVHGSIGFDIDLVACPWRDAAVDAASVAEAIRSTAEAIIGTAFLAPHEESRQPEKKPYGRLAWSFHLGGGPYIDLSVMPTTHADISES